MRTSGGYHEYIRGCSGHRRDTMSTLGDYMSTSGRVFPRPFTHGGDLSPQYGGQVQGENC